MSRTINPYHYYDKILLWLDGNDVFGNESASIPTNNSSIDKWFDKSPNRYVFTASSGNEPTYDATNKKVTFDGTEHMSCSVSNFPTTTFHMFVVGSITITDDSQTNVLVSGDTAGNAGDFTFIAEVDTGGSATPDVIQPKISYKSAANASDQTATSCLLYTSPSPRDATTSRMPSSA